MIRKMGPMVAGKYKMCAAVCFPVKCLEYRRESISKRWEEQNGWGKNNARIARNHERFDAPSIPRFTNSYKYSASKYIVGRYRAHLDNPNDRYDIGT